jgi:hypothetical protein
MSRNKIDDLVKSPKSLFFVIPAKAGIQYFHRVTKNLDPVFQRSDDFLRNRQNWETSVAARIFKSQEEATAQFGFNLPSAY